MDLNNRQDLVELLDLPPSPGVNQCVADLLPACSPDDLNTLVDQVGPTVAPEWVRAPLWLLIYRVQCRGLNTFARYEPLPTAESREAHCRDALAAMEHRGANLLLKAEDEDALFVEQLVGSVTATSIVAPHAEMAQDLLNERRHVLEAAALTAATTGLEESTKARPRL